MSKLLLCKYWVVCTNCGNRWAFEPMAGASPGDIVRIACPKCRASSADVLDLPATTKEAPALPYQEEAAVS